MASNGDLIGIPGQGGGARATDPGIAQFGLPLTLIPDPEIPQYIPDSTTGTMVRTRPGHIYGTFYFYRNEEGALRKRAVRENDIDPMTGTIYARNPETDRCEWTKPWFTPEGEMYLFKRPENAYSGFRPGDAIVDKGTPLFVFDSNANAFTYATKGQYVGKGVPGERDEKYASEITAYVPQKTTGIATGPGGASGYDIISLKGSADDGWIGLCLSKDKFYEVYKKGDKEGTWLKYKTDKDRNPIASFDEKGNKWDLQRGEGMVLGNGLKPMPAWESCPKMLVLDNNRINPKMSEYCNSARVGFDKDVYLKTGKVIWRTPVANDVYALRNAETGSHVFLTDSDNQSPNEMDYGQGNPNATARWAYGRLIDRVDGDAAETFKTSGMMVYGDLIDPDKDKINIPKAKFTQAVMSIFRGHVPHDILNNPSRTSVPMTNLFHKAWTLDISHNDSAWKRAGIGSRIVGICLGVGAVVGGVSAAVAVAPFFAVPMIGAVAIGVGTGALTSVGAMFTAQQTTKEKAYNYVLRPEIRLRRQDIVNDFNKSDMFAITELSDAIKIGLKRLATKTFIAVGGVDGAQKLYNNALIGAGITAITGVAIAAMAIAAPALAVPLVAAGALTAIGGGGGIASAAIYGNRFINLGAANLIDKVKNFVAAPIRNNEYPGSDWIGHRTSPSSNLLIDPFKSVFPAIMKKYGVEPNSQVEEDIRGMQHRLQILHGAPFDKEPTNGKSPEKEKIGEQTGKVLQRREDTLQETEQYNRLTLA